MSIIITLKPLLILNTNGMFMSVFICNLIFFFCRTRLIHILEKLYISLAVITLFKQLCNDNVSFLVINSTATRKTVEKLSLS